MNTTTLSLFAAIPISLAALNTLTPIVNPLQTVNCPYQPGIQLVILPRSNPDPRELQVNTTTVAYALNYAPVPTTLAYCNPSSPNAKGGVLVSAYKGFLTLDQAKDIQLRLSIVQGKSFIVHKP